MVDRINRQKPTQPQQPKGPTRDEIEDSEIINTIAIGRITKSVTRFEPKGLKGRASLKPIGSTAKTDMAFTKAMSKGFKTKVAPYL